MGALPLQAEAAEDPKVQCKNKAMEVQEKEIKVNVSKPEAAGMTNQKAMNELARITVKEYNRSCMGSIYHRLSPRVKTGKQSLDHINKILMSRATELRLE